MIGFCTETVLVMSETSANLFCYRRGDWLGPLTAWSLSRSWIIFAFSALRSSQESTTWSTRAVCQLDPPAKPVQPNSTVSEVLATPPPPHPPTPVLVVVHAWGKSKIYGSVLRICRILAITIRLYKLYMYFVSDLYCNYVINRSLSYPLLCIICIIVHKSVLNQVKSS